MIRRGTISHNCHLTNNDKYQPRLSPWQDKHDDRLPLSELFHSLQGEGRWCGTPAVFIRLLYCNMGCCWCDTAYAWDRELIDTAEFLTSGDIAELAYRSVSGMTDNRELPHIVITGGEPMLHQHKIPELIDNLKSKGFSFFEIETNGTIVPSGEMLEVISWWNCSPKLSNNLLPEESRINMTAIESIAGTGRADFKFVVHGSEDADEIESTFGKIISPEKIWLMPEDHDAEGQLERMRVIAELCIQRGYRFSPRLHVLLWGKERGR